MSAEPLPAADGQNDLVGRIHDLQEEIFDLEDQIDDLVDSAADSENLETVAEEAESERRLRHIDRLIDDWRQLLARSRESSDNDFELAAAMVRFVGDLLLIQPDGTDRWFLQKLATYLEAKRLEMS